MQNGLKFGGMVAALVALAGCSVLQKTGFVTPDDVASACATATAVCQSADVPKTPEQAQACAVVIAACASQAKPVE